MEKIILEMIDSRYRKKERQTDRERENEFSKEIQGEVEIYSGSRNKLRERNRER